MSADTAREPRFVVDGTTEHGQLDGGAKDPPFCVFDVVRQEHLPIAYEKLADARVAAIAAEIAVHAAKENPPAYYSEPFVPHQWVIDAVAMGMAGAALKEDVAIRRLAAERDEADRRAGAAERENANLRDTAMRRASWLHRAKEEAGYNDRVSFDDVWKETLAKAKRLDEILVTGRIA